MVITVLTFFRRMLLVLDRHLSAADPRNSKANYCSYGGNG